MEIKTIYSREQFEATIKFLVKNNFRAIDTWKPEDSYLFFKESILNTMDEIANSFPNINYYYSTGGYTIIPSILSEEGIDDDSNIIEFTILVNPSVKSNTEWEEDDCIEKNFVIEKKYESENSIEENS